MLFVKANMIPYTELNCMGLAIKARKTMEHAFVLRLF